MNIGKLKAIFDREFGYISKLNFLMIVYIFVKEAGIHWWYILLIPLFLLWIYIDLKYIMPKEFDYLSRKNPILMDIWKK